MQKKFRRSCPMTGRSAFFPTKARQSPDVSPLPLLCSDNYFLAACSATRHLNTQAPSLAQLPVRLCPSIATLNCKAFVVWCQALRAYHRSEASCAVASSLTAEISSSFIKPRDRSAKLQIGPQRLNCTLLTCPRFLTFSTSLSTSTDKLSQHCRG